MYTFLHFWRELSRSSILYRRAFICDCHTFTLNNRSLQETKTFYCAIRLHFVLKLWMFKGAPYVRRCFLDEAGFKISGIRTVGFVFKTIRRWEFSYNLAVKGNIILYIAFVATMYHFYFINNIRISKNYQPYPSPYTHCKDPALPLPLHIPTHTLNLQLCPHPYTH